MPNDTTTPALSSDTIPTVMPRITAKHPHHPYIIATLAMLACLACSEAVAPAPAVGGPCSLVQTVAVPGLPVVVLTAYYTVCPDSSLWPAGVTRGP